MFVIQFLLLVRVALNEFKRNELSFRFGISFGILYFVFIPLSLMIFTGTLIVSKKDFGGTLIPDVVFENELWTSLQLILFIGGIILFLNGPKLRELKITKRLGSNGWKLPLFIYVILMLSIFIGSGMLNGGNWYNNRHHFMAQGGSLAVLMMFFLNASKVMFISSLIYKWKVKEIKLIYFLPLIFLFLLVDMILTGNRIYAFIAVVIIGLNFLKEYPKIILKYSIIGLPAVYYAGYFASIFRHMRGPLFLYGIPTPSYFIEVLNGAIKVEPPDVYNFLSGISESVNVNVIYGLLNQYSTPLYGTTYLKTILFPIPRKVWVGKPITITNIAGDIFGSESLVTTFIGEVFMNFLFWGVLILPVFLFFTEWVFRSYFNRVLNGKVLLFFVGLMIFRMPYSDTVLIFTFIFFLSYLGSLSINKIISTINEKLG